MSKNVKARQSANLATPTDLGANATKDISGGLNILLADVFALYLKTKNFHWHVSGPHFRDYHLLLDEQADQIYAMGDPIAERVAQARRQHPPLDRPDQEAAARARQRRRLRHAARHAGRAARGQQAARHEHARRSTRSATSTTTSPPRA